LIAGRIRLRRVKFAAAVTALLCVTPASAEAPPALLLHNGNIYTADPSEPRREALLAVDGRIAYVGTRAGALLVAPSGARLVDLQGKTVFPGFADAHAHLSDIGWRELNFDLTGVESLAALQTRLRERAAQDRNEWIVGIGWIESKWSPAVFPTRQDLDEAVTSRPVLLERADGHAVVVNSLALKLAGIDRVTPDPEGGQILRDAETGQPTGMLIDSAVSLVRRLVPPATDEELAQALETGATRSVSLGWTQLQIAGTSWREIDVLCRLYASGRLKLRLYAAIAGPGPDAEQLLGVGRKYESCDPRLTVRSIKLFIDGALGSRGAALEEPYSDAPDSRGLFVTPPEEILRITIAGLKSGIQIETHAIGDRGNRLVLDQYEKALAAVPDSERPVRDPRLRIEHAQVVAARDMPRFAKLGVIASMQTSHAISDMLFAPARLGPGRIAGAYAWRSLFDAGALIAGGSDAPVEKGDPLVEFYAAVARRTLEGHAGSDWGLDQRLTRDEALGVLTTGPAYAAFEEKERGSIVPGKLADLSVFSADLMTIAEAEIPRARAEMTVIGGEIVYQAP